MLEENQTSARIEGFSCRGDLLDVDDDRAFLGRTVPFFYMLES